MKEIKTYWSTQPIPYGAFEDYIILESHNLNQRLLMYSQEFDSLCRKLFENWMKKKSKYIQILKEWNESSGYNDIEGNPSIILDIDDTIDALKLIKTANEIKHYELTKSDLNLIIDFLIRNKNHELVIREE